MHELFTSDVLSHVLCTFGCTLYFHVRKYKVHPKVHLNVGINIFSTGSTKIVQSTSESTSMYFWLYSVLYVVLCTFKNSTGCMLKSTRCTLTSTRCTLKSTHQKSEEDMINFPKRFFSIAALHAAMAKYTSTSLTPRCHCHRLPLHYSCKSNLPLRAPLPCCHRHHPQHIYTNQLLYRLECNNLHRSPHLSTLLPILIRLHPLPPQISGRRVTNSPWPTCTPSPG
jgi:hypothetical protein